MAEIQSSVREPPSPKGSSSSSFSGAAAAEELLRVSCVGRGGRGGGAFELDDDELSLPTSPNSVSREFGERPMRE